MNNGKPDLAEDEIGAKLADYLAGSLRDRLGLKAGDLDLGLNKAKLKVQSGQPEEAMKLYLGMVLLEPSNVTYLGGLANCALMTGNPDLALKTASLMVALAPDNPHGFYFSGAACLALGRRAEALEDMQDAVRLAGQAKDEKVGALAAAALARLAHH
jgi:tetratricopeptide (TPR) repeat protein